MGTMMADEYQRHNRLRTIRGSMIKTWWMVAAARTPGAVSFSRGGGPGTLHAELPPLDPCNFMQMTAIEC
jgi:hypothetical protein